MGVRSSQEAKRVGLRKCSCSGEDERTRTEQGRETAAQVARNEELELTELHPPSTMAEFRRLQLSLVKEGLSPMTE